MCRIAGIIDKKGLQLERDVISMRDAMMRGGPDSSGIYLDEYNSLAFGHRRLSIIDLSNSGHQPMLNEAGDVVLIFNGEIYNYLELRDTLIKAGSNFFSHSDTEVILKGYQLWGTACFSKLKGMFAIGLFDKKKKRVILARDHAGIKPLYYYADKDSIYFASEIRAFKEIKNKWQEDHLWKVHFLTYGFLPNSVTTLKGIRPVEKGSFIIFNIETFQSEQSFFYRDTYSEVITNEVEARELVRENLQRSVKRHMIADAPIGLFLSGGLDSSLLTIVAKQFKKELHTLSIIFSDEKYSEKHYQQIVVNHVGTKHQEFLLDKKQFVQAVPDILMAMDQPSADGINSYFISKFAKEAGLKAVLSGLGADELFGGYPSFKRNRLIKNLKYLPRVVLLGASLLPRNKFRKISFLNAESCTGNYLFNRGYFTPLETAKLLNMDFSEVISLLHENDKAVSINELSEGNKTSYLENNLYMQGQLLKDTDFMSMWNSIEVRVPFLDVDLIRLVHSISSKLKFENKQGKYLLIDSFKEKLPREIWDRKKKGFQLPFDGWMNGSLDQFISSKRDRDIHQRFKSGKMGWSRYWAYVLSQNFNA